MKKFSIFICLVSLFVVALFVTGCSAFNVGVKDFLEKYTETAGVGAFELDGIYPTDNSGVTCIDSERNHSIALTLRNPKNLGVLMVYEFDNAELNPWYNASPDQFGSEYEKYNELQNNVFAKIIDMSSDNLSCKLNFPKDFLKDVELGNVTDSDGAQIFIYDRNISGKL